MSNFHTSAISNVGLQLWCVDRRKNILSGCIHSLLLQKVVGLPREPPWQSYGNQSWNHSWLASSVFSLSSSSVVQSIGGAKNIIKILCFSASITSRSKRSDGTVRSNTLVSIPSTAFSYFVDSQTSESQLVAYLCQPCWSSVDFMTNNSSMEKPENFWTGEKCLTVHCAWRLGRILRLGKNSWLRLQRSVMNFGDTRKRPLFLMNFDLSAMTKALICT